MSLLTREKLRSELKAKRVVPLYLLFGAEDFLRDAAARRIADEALRGASLREFNEATFSLASVDVQQAIANAEQLPMMAERRVVRITDFAKLREADEGALLRYLARPVESSVVIFIADELDKRRKLSKTLLDACTSVEFATLAENELATWAREQLKKHKADADERTLRQIIALVGTSVRRLANELDKLATAALSNDGRITMELVETLVSHSREHSNFELTDRLIAKDRKGALKTLRRLLDNEAEPVMLVGLIASNYHRLALAKALMSGGAPEQEVFNIVKMPYSSRQEFLATARRTDSADLARRISRIASTDLAIKTSLGTPRLQLELLICELSS
ncbi:MAG TPA: DNA polymerase III subunit delta [Pyrinomonadaceae bacterium]|jgi:DNA polymerase-3 subunit delta|nr:DNA polymerase III subunit delta [Pyrinomonadaceae bacterium]